MKKFMIFYMADPAAFETMMQNSTPETRKKGMEAWMKWMDHNKALFVDRGAPVMPGTVLDVAHQALANLALRHGAVRKALAQGL